MNPKEKIFTLDYVVLLLGAVILFSLFSGLLFILPLYILDIGGGESSVGLAAGIFMFVAVALRPFVGPLVDRYGGKKIMIFGLCVFCLGTFLYILAYKVFSVFILRAIQGAAWGGLVAAVYTLAAVMAPKTRQAEALGYFALVTSLGSSIGPALAEFIKENYSFFSTFNTLGVLTLVCLFLFFKLKVQEPVAATQKDPGQKQSFIVKAVLMPSIIGMMTTMSFGTIMSFMSILGEVRGIEKVGIFFTVQGAVMVAGRVFAGKVVDRFGHYPVLAVSIICTFFAMVIVALAPSLSVLLLGGALFGLGISSVTPALMSLAVVLSSEEERGRAMSTFTGFYDLGIGIGSVGFGYLLEVTSITTVYLTCAGFLLLDFFFVLYQNRLHKSGFVGADEAAE